MKNLNKKLIIKLIEGKNISQKDINEFIYMYVQYKKNIELTPEQFSGIQHLLSLGIFTLNNALEDCAKQLNMQILTIVKENSIIKSTVYEC